MSPWESLFPAQDYRFHLTLQRGELGAFFAPMDPTGAVRRQRARWLAEEPARYAQLRPPGQPLLDEFCELVAPGLAADPRSVGAALEPDLLLLARDAAGAFRLEGGALCFPTGWALEEKIGHTLDEIHSGVPGLNPALAAPLNRFLDRLRPGPAFLRDNWGLYATAELNLHPTRPRPRLELPLDPDRIWLRIERQALAALPRTGGIVFGIRIELHPLTAVLADPVARTGLARALATMAPDMAAYKGIAAVRDALVKLAAR